MRKKFISILALLLTASVLAGCAGGDNNSSNLDGSQGAKEPVSITGGSGGHDLKLMTPSQTHNEVGFPAQEGVYQCIAYNGQYGLYYIDYATHQKVALCSRPECRHNDSTCAAWMPNYGAPFVIGDKLYLWCLPEWTEKGAGPYYIQKRELDGSEAETLWEADSGEMLTSAIVADDEYFYFFTYQMAETADKEDIESANYWNRVKISDGSREKLGKLGVNDGYDLLGAVGDKVLLFGFGGENGTDRALFFCDPETFEITPAFSYDGEKLCYQYLDGEKLYLVDIDENALKVVNLLTNDITTVFADLGLAEPQTARTQAVVDDRYVALYAYEEADNFYEQIVYSYALDLQEQTIQKLNFRYAMDHGTTDPYQVLNILPDGKLLVKTGREVAYYKMENFGLVQDVEFIFNREAITTVEDFFGGTDNFTPIESPFLE